VRIFVDNAVKYSSHGTVNILAKKWEEVANLASKSRFETRE